MTTTQIIQPGNVPAWSNDTPANEIAEVFEQDIWPVVFQKLLFSYANEGARLAELAGLGSSDRAFAFDEDTKTFWRWTGTAWALAAPWVQRGSFAVPGISAGGGVTSAVTFTNPFPGTAYTVVYELNSTRLSAVTSAIPSKAASGFTAGINNFTTGSSSSGTVTWEATYAP